MFRKNKNNERKCLPVDTYEELRKFYHEPPIWYNFCEELTEHSDKAESHFEILENESDWMHLFYCHGSNKPEAFKSYRVSRELLPKTLVCHDYANGYQDDSHILGTIAYDAYNFYNWAVVDIFCYFSHHFITIPPLGWINVAHKHGVKVIGTIITEWQAGEKIWEQILKSESDYKEFAHMLTAITQQFKFEGWLLNVENKINKPENLKKFVKYFHQLLHSKVKNATLIWYDSVTNNGNLNWQNGLTLNNNDFFNITDGIFTNYSWQECDIEKSRQLAGDRVLDVFVGIDVWGRNFYGGGEFNTDEAVRLAHKHGCSLAIFAQAWTHEAVEIQKDPDITEELEKSLKFEQFLLRDRALWDTLWPFLNSKLPKQLPFKTSFCRGQGTKKRVLGEVIRNGPWFNLRSMQYQLNSSHGVHGYRLVKTDSKKDTIRDKTLPTNTEDNNIEESSNPKADTYYDLSTAGDDVIEEVIPLGHGKYTTFDYIEELQGEEPTNECNVLKKKFNVQRYKLVVTDDLPCHDYYTEDAYNGGSCIRVNSVLVDNDAARIKLLNCDFRLDNKIILYTISKKCGYNNLDFFIEIEDTDSDKFTVLLSGDMISDNLHKVAVERRVGFVVLPINLADPKHFKHLQRYLFSKEPDFSAPISNRYGWETRYYIIDRPNSTINSISCEVNGPGEGYFLLGEMGLCLYEN